MEPQPSQCSDSDKEIAVLDTGQSGSSGSAATQPAQPAHPDGLLSGGLLSQSGCNQDGPKNAVEAESTDADKPLALEGAAKPQAQQEEAAEATPPGVCQSDGGSPLKKTEADPAGSESDKSVSVGVAEESRERREVSENVMSVAPKIVIEQESADNSNDDDMDPLIANDDTESQSSDLINFDTVSYDVIHQHSGEEDDDEKSIATLSSLSCDIKLDSPSKHSLSSNSVSLSNLLDFSIKETLGLAVNPSESAASSCPSSPSLRSAKTVSSAVDESISEAFMNVLQISEDEAGIVNCDNKVLSQKDLPSEDKNETENEDPVADLSACSHVVDVPGEPRSIDESIEVPCGNLEVDTNGASVVSSPVGENLSLIEPSHSIATSSSPKCSPAENFGLVSNKSNQMSIGDNDCNHVESLIVPDNSVINSSEDVKDVLEECLVNSSSELENLEPSAHLVPKENDKLESDGEEMKENGALLSPSPTSANPENVDCEVANAVIQDSNDNLVGICKEEDSVVLLSCKINSAEATETPQVISSTLTDENIPPAIQDIDIIAATVSSTTEDEENVLTSTQNDDPSLPLVSSTSNEDPSCGAAAPSSTLESTANDNEEQVSSQKSPAGEDIAPEENITSSSALLVGEKNLGEDNSDKIISSSDGQNTEEIPDTSEIVRTPSPADSALSVSNYVTSEESTQRLSCDSSNETMELMSLEATNGDLSSASDRVSVSNVLAGNGNDAVEVTENVSQRPINCDATKPITLETLNKVSKAEEPLLNGALSVGDVDNKTKRPTTLPNIDLSTPSSAKSSSMNFSEFLGLFNTPSVEDMPKPKQYDVAALDEAQQMASSFVDDILQIAMTRAEEKLTSSESLVGDRVEAVQVAQILVDGVLTEASAHVSYVDGMAEISSTCDIKDSKGDYSSNSFASDDVQSQVTNNTLTAEPCHVSEQGSSISVLDEQLDSQKNSMNILKDKKETKTEHSEAIAEQFPEENVISCNDTCAETAPNMTSDSTSDSQNISEDNSLSDSLVDLQSKDSVRTSSTENAGTDSARSSLLTTSEQGLRSEASLFVDGVLQEAVKKYEESSSSDSSPVKIRSLALNSDFLQEDEELATPCGEMLTEHFMDFESGRNVSVFCSIPENRNEDHLLAYDRVAHTIGNREVDSDTGKSVSVFRMEEDVFYEIQRASTCTSVFESVEEEDEDMIDTTIPVEERPEKTLPTSASFPSYDKDKFGAPDDLFSSDCDAFEDAVGAFLTKERLAHNELRHRGRNSKADPQEESQQQSEVTCRALVLRHPEIGISNSDEKKRMAEKWANGGESEVPDTPEMREKQKAIREALDSEDDVAVKLCRLALTEGGLINDSLRREAWPRMLGLDPTLEVNAPSLEELKSHPEYGQVVLDVNRSLKRFPPDIPKDQRETLQDKLTRLIMYVISKHPHLRYYQGYHDVAVTFLLVVGESIAFQIMERLSTEHLSDCMQPTMERTSYLLHFIYPLLHRLHPTLADYLERSEVGTMFCLPWFLTWFGHSLDHYKDVVRLYDHFLASPPLAPLYVAAVLVAHRADEVLAVDCDMAAIHALLSHIPDSLPLEILLRDATDLYMKFPPESIEREVEERFRNEQDMRVQEMEARERVQRQRALRLRRHASGSWQLAELQDRIGGSMMVLNRWMPPWVVQQQRLSMRLLFASATFFVGFYVYSRGGDMLPYP